MTSSIDRSRERAAAMRMYIEMFHAIRDVIFGKGLRREGDTTVELVAAAVALGHSEGRPMNASNLAYYLELPRSTVREKLAVLVATGVIVRVGNKYYLEPGRAKSPSREVSRRFGRILSRACKDLAPFLDEMVRVAKTAT